jgi:hypothetical protein
LSDSPQSLFSGIVVSRDETNSRLGVDADAVLTEPISVQSFEPIPPGVSNSRSVPADSKTASLRTALFAIAGKCLLFPLSKYTVRYPKSFESRCQRNTPSVTRIPFYSAWHTGHQNRFRPPKILVSTFFPQMKHGLPCLR